MNQEFSQTVNSSPAAADDDEINLLDLAQVVVDNLRLLVLGPLAAGLVALGISFAITPTFTATTVFLPPQQQQGAASMLLQSLGGALGGLAGAATGLKNPNDQFVSFLQSDVIANTLIDRFKLMERYKADFKVDARKALDNASAITSGKDGLITVEMNDKDPVVAAQIANAYVEELGKLLNRLSLTEAQNRRAFFEKQLSQTKDKLTAAEQALNGSGINVSTLKSSPEAAITIVASLQAQIMAQEVKLSSMRGYLTESAPDFKQAQTELAALRAQFASVEKSTTSASGANADYVARYRDFKYYETLYELFAKQFEVAKVDEAREGNVIQVVDVAQPPEKKSKPKKATIAVLTTFVTGFALLIFVFMRNSLKDANQDPETLEKLSKLRSAWRRAIGRSGA
ncbi:Wzz/FepE/Etk N-terminal domain-containing protein [Rhodoferax sp.]|uniref:Wzz/FepE/Etk N-terminal domain-containing protein n=1 Tax=Rhodoferax sp. TaxID=50421 RepID=UPI0028460903|nr:Wzz/FepE/Etk N-terminal domain-containing protein [Rhodoferax sp.]MDR3368595.1 Wzz/FepE/Etk N-terminal domain-containing protein [Rhodoferax sp.]